MNVNIFLPSWKSKWVRKANLYTAGNAPKRKKSLLATFRDNTTRTELPGKNGVVSFRDIAQKILYDKWYTDKAPYKRSQRKRIVKTASAIIREDVRSYILDGDTYPAASSLEETVYDLVQETLNCFVITLPSNARNKYSDRKTAAIQQAIMAAGCPRSFVSPVLLSVSVCIHASYGCEDLTNLMHNLGFSKSYTEAVR